jgi:HK97 family phage major capsid protein
MTVHDIAAYTDITRRMLMQSTIGIEQYARNQLVTAMAQAIDTAGWYGAGSGGVPEGLAQTTGIGSVTFAAAVPTRDELIDMDTRIGNTNQTGEPSFVSTTAMGGALRKAKVDDGSGVFLMNRSNQLEIGNPFTRTNQITAGDVFAGVFEDMLMGMWGGLELDRSTEAKFLSGGLRLRAIQSVDFAVARVGSFVLGNDG